MNIYIDLDETLIHAKYSIPGHSGNPGKRTAIKIIDEDGLNHETYHSLIRPKALELLNHCRKLTKVKMLTTATRDYAILHNETFLLGFEPAEIIAREDYLVRTSLAYGTTTEPSKRRTDPNAFLIDNLPRLAEAAMLKQQYLGIRPENYIEIREFSGKDPEIFSQELKDILTLLEDNILKPKTRDSKLIQAGQAEFQNNI